MRKKLTEVITLGKRKKEGGGFREIGKSIEEITSAKC